MIVRRASKSSSILEKSKQLMAFRENPTDGDIASNDLEIEIVGLFAGMVQLGSFFRSSTGVTTSVREAVEAYRHSFLILDDDFSFANAESNICLMRLDQYHDEIASHPDNWVLPLATRIAENCIGEGATKDVGAVVEMSILFGFFMKVIEESLRQWIFRA